MWTRIKWGIRIVLILIVGLFLHYTLPQRDIVYITDTRNQITTIGANWMFYAIVSDGAPRCVNILDNRRVSGPAKAALIKRFSMPDATLPAAARLALRQSGLPESLIAKIGGYGCD